MCGRHFSGGLVRDPQFNIGSVCPPNDLHPDVLSCACGWTSQLRNFGLPHTWLMLLVLGISLFVMASTSHAAGVVTTQMSGNTLTLTGDGQGNRIQLKYANSALIVGVTDYDDGTRIQGKNTFLNFKGDIVVNLNGGNDRFRVYDSQISLTNLTVDMGTGESEEVDIRNLTLAGNLAITSRGTKLNSSVSPGSGSDIRVESVVIRGNVRINTGTGTDLVTILPLDATPPRISGNVSIDTRDGDDFVGIGINGSHWPNTSAQIGGTVTIRTGAGPDICDLWVKMSGVDVLLGDGDDTLYAYVCGTRGGSAKLDGGAGSDWFRNSGGNSSSFTQGLVGFERR